MHNKIHHQGVIARIEAGRVYVKIVQQSACSGCHAKSVCHASESKEKEIEIEDFSDDFQVGETVTIWGQTAFGLQAVWLAFVLPLLFLVAALVLGSVLQWSETIAGLAGLCTLLPYYYLLYRMRDQLKRRFVFQIRKSN